MKAEKKQAFLWHIKYNLYLCTAFKKCNNMVAVVQLVRASDCGSECRGFESHLPPHKKSSIILDYGGFYYSNAL